MEGLTKQEELDIKKSDLINDLMAVGTVLDELWRYHPDNPKQKDVIAEYNQLIKIQGDIELELKGLSEID
tara:strand:+ start:45 stop:254 length:210 start_codon:yes stop_codon:yes gene_type:complete